MRSLQIIGFLIAVLAVFLGYMLLSPVEAGTPASAAGASGLGLIFLVAPGLALSVLIPVPSSIALVWPEVRKRNHMHGAWWYGLWAVNSIISLGYSSIAVYMDYVWVTVGAGN